MVKNTGKISRSYVAAPAKPKVKKPHKRGSKPGSSKKKVTIMNKVHHGCWSNWHSKKYLMVYYVGTMFHDCNTVSEQWLISKENPLFSP